MITRITLFIIFLAITGIAYTQENPGTGTVTVFSQDGAKFTLYLNGDQKNAVADTRVVATNISEVPVSFRIVFENSTIPEIKKNGIRQGKHCLYAIVKDKKGGYALKVGGCDESEPEGIATSVNTTATTSTTASTSVPDQLSATYNEGLITINDGRTLKVTKIKVNGMTYPRIHFTALQGATISLAYDNGNETYSAESPMEYEVKDFSNNNAYVTVTVDEGGPSKTWHVKLKNANGYDLKIE